MRTLFLIAAAAALPALHAAPAAAADAAPDPLAPLAWMAGEWSGTDGGVAMEEIWTEPKGGMMLGVHRDVKDGRAVSFEFFRIEATPEGITYFAQPHGKPATPFRLTESKDRRVVFANPEHDFPKRIHYWLSRDGALHARIDGGEGSSEKPMEWTWRKGRVVPAK
jgi:hypothetical protein